MGKRNNFAKNLYVVDKWHSCFQCCGLLSNCHAQLRGGSLIDPVVDSLTAIRIIAHYFIQNGNVHLDRIVLYLLHLSSSLHTLSFHIYLGVHVFALICDGFSYHIEMYNFIVIIAFLVSLYLI